MNKRIKKKKEIEMMRNYNSKLFKASIKNGKDRRFLKRMTYISWKNCKKKGLDISKVVNGRYTATAMYIGPKEAESRGFPVYKPIHQKIMIIL